MLGAIVKELNLSEWTNSETGIMKTLMLSVMINYIQDPNQRRWVEFNDYLSVRSPNGNKIPPKWQGWMSQQYDDVPAPDGDRFHDPFF